jgi:tRNA(Ile)-lysidine synthase
MRAYANRVGHAQDLEHKHVVEMARQVTKRSGIGVDLPNGIRFVVDRDSLGFQSGNEDDCPYPEPLKPTELALPGTTELNGGFILSTEMIERPVALNPNNPWVAFTSPEIASLAPKLRNRKNGDRFQPLGMEPLVKLQDYLVGAGIPERWRDRVPIVESSKGIVWIVGSRLAQWAKVQAEHSQVARLELMRTD